MSKPDPQPQPQLDPCRDITSTINLNYIIRETTWLIYHLKAQSAAYKSRWKCGFSFTHPLGHSRLFIYPRNNVTITFVIFTSRLKWRQALFRQSIWSIWTIATYTYNESSAIMKERVFELRLGLFLHGINLKSSSALSGMTETIKKLTKVSCCPNPGEILRGIPRQFKSWQLWENQPSPVAAFDNWKVATFLSIIVVAKFC